MTTETKAAREFSDKRREKLAASGAAMPDGSYPIPDKDALRRAIQSYGRAKDPEAVKQHIIKRARALGATSMLPEDWAVKGSMAAGHASMGADILEGLYDLVDCESGEPAQASLLTQAADLVLRWMGLEHQEIGQPGDDAEDMGKARILPVRKSLTELKAEPLTQPALESWLAGERSRRIMVIPFGGPLPGGKAGLDLDGEYFDERTDLYGPFPGLRASRERIVDWHHDDDQGVPSWVPTMKGTIMGRLVLDEGPSVLHTDDGDYEGVAADFWAKAGERRLALIKALQERGRPVFGSSQAVAKAVRVEEDGHIALWPVYRHTLSTSPQNTYAVVPPLKALLAADLSFDDVGVAALRAALAGIGDLGPDLQATSPGGREGKRAAKARRLSMALDEAERTLARVRAHSVRP